MTDSCNKTFRGEEQEGRWDEHRVSRNPVYYCTALCGASRLNRKKKRKKRTRICSDKPSVKARGRRNEPSDQLFNLSKWIIHNDTLISRRNTIRGAINGSHVGAASQTGEAVQDRSLKVIKVKSQWPYGWFRDPVFTQSEPIHLRSTAVTESTLYINWVKIRCLELRHEERNWKKKKKVTSRRK